MNYILKKIFQFPSPVDLGLSKHNAMPLRSITPNCNEPSWEDYYEILKMRYPIRYFLYEIVDNFILWFNVKFIINIFNAIYKFKCHFFKSHKFHLLDLRQPNTDTRDDYKYGYQEPSEKITFAVFNLLNEYVENQYYWITKKDLKETDISFSELKKQYELQQEILYLHKWWNIYRKEDLRELDILSNEWFNIRHSPAINSEKEKQLRQDVIRMELDLEDEIDRHLIRVIKVRQGMWK